MINKVAFILAILFLGTTLHARAQDADMRSQMQGAVNEIQGQMADLERQIAQARKSGNKQKAEDLQREFDSLGNTLGMMQGGMKAILDNSGKRPQASAVDQHAPASDASKVRAAETFDGLISKGVATGKLNTEQAWRYRIAARFHPELVPVEFRPKPDPSRPGAKARAGSDNFLNGLASDFPSLSANAKQEFIGYFIPPTYAGSKLPGARPLLGRSEGEGGGQASSRTHNSRARPAFASSNIAKGRFLRVQDVQSGSTPGPQPLRPDNSWVWDSMESSDLKVWWLKENTFGERDARLLLQEFPAVRAKLDSAMRRTYLSDAGVHKFDGNVVVTEKSGFMGLVTTHEKKFVSLNWGDGGNGKLDIYLVDFSGPESALTIAYPPGCSARPSFILMDTTSAHTARMDLPPDMEFTAAYGQPGFVRSGQIDDDKRHLMLAHEYMHVLQNTFVHGLACDDYQKVDEGIANWAGNFVFPHNWYLEYHYADWFPAGWVSLVLADYDTWPFYVFVEHTSGADTIRHIFENYANRAGVDAVDAAVPGGFKRQWSEYTVREWNQGDAVEDFRTWKIWDHIPWDSHNVPTEKIRAIPDTRGNFRTDRDISLAPLTRQYFHFIFDDARIRSIRFDQAMGLDPRPTSKAKLKALVKHKGKSWEVEDWSANRDAVEFCQDVPSENVEEVVLAFSNYDREGSGSRWQMLGEFLPDQMYRNTAIVEATNLACKGWLGNFTAEFARNESDAIDDLQTKSHAEFERAGVNETGNFIGRFHAASGAGTYSYTGKRRTSGNQWCRGSAAGVFQVAKGTAGNSIGLYPSQVGTPNERMYSGGIVLVDPPRVDVTFQCPGDLAPIHDMIEMVVWFPGSGRRYKADASGNLVGQDSTGYTKYTWDVRPKQKVGF